MGSVLLAVLLLVAVAVVTHWILGRALLPVSRMTEDAAAWSDHDLDRLDLGEPYDELTRLAATLDSLLGRLSAGLRHERDSRPSCLMSCGRRSRGSRQKRSLRSARNEVGGDYRASLEAVQRNAEQMRRTVEALVSAARQEAGHDRSSCRNAAAGIRAAVAAVREDAEASGIGALIVAVPAAPVRLAVEDELLERIIHPLLDNAVQYGAQAVSVELIRNGTTAIINVLDDGVGVRAAERDAIFEPGVRGSYASAKSGGAGLGLALAKRLARSAGGRCRHAQRGGGASSASTFLWRDGCHMDTARGATRLQIDRR